MSRIILKISGEALKDEGKNVSNNKLEIVLRTINKLKDNHQIGIVIGGGNFFRGRENANIEKVTGDTIGMLSTIINSLYLKDYLEKNNLKVILSNPFNFNELMDKYNNDELKDYYDNNHIIIFGGGIGKSGFSTDSGAILAADILNSDLIIKMTNVDGVYDSDPKNNPNAKKYNRLTYDEVIDKNLKVMDLYAIEKCKEKNISILVINFNDYKKISEAINNKNIGTYIGD